jgi:hypothetical protein
MLVDMKVKKRIGPGSPANWFNHILSLFKIKTVTASAAGPWRPLATLTGNKFGPSTKLNQPTKVLGTGSSHLTLNMSKC